MDIGGFTADYLQVKYGQADLSVCDSLENGVIVLYNRIKSKINADFDMLLEESDIDAILLDKPQEYDEVISRIVREQAQLFIDDLIGKLRERMIDLRSGKTIFVGGGSILLRNQIEACGKVGAALFVRGFLWSGMVYVPTAGRSMWCSGTRTRLRRNATSGPQRCANARRPPAPLIYANR